MRNRFSRPLLFHIPFSFRFLLLMRDTPVAGEVKCHFLGVLSSVDLESFSAFPHSADIEDRSPIILSGDVITFDRSFPEFPY